jgi:hypothetical protein
MRPECRPPCNHLALDTNFNLEGIGGQLDTAKHSWNCCDAGMHFSWLGLECELSLARPNRARELFPKDRVPNMPKSMDLRSARLQTCARLPSPVPRSLFLLPALWSLRALWRWRILGSVFSLKWSVFSKSSLQIDIAYSA